MADINLDDEAFELLRRQVKATEAENLLNQNIVTNLKLSNRLNNEVVQRYAHLGEVVSGLVEELRDNKEASIRTLEAVQNLIAELKRVPNSATYMDSISSALAEMVEEISRRWDRFELRVSQRIGQLEDIGLAGLTGKEIPTKKRTRLKKGLLKEQKLLELKQHYLNLAELRLVAAKYGSLNVPLHVATGIKEEEEIIQALEAELNE